MGKLNNHKGLASFDWMLVVVMIGFIIAIFAAIAIPLGKLHRDSKTCLAVTYDIQTGENQYFNQHNEYTDMLSNLQLPDSTWNVIRNSEVAVEMFYRLNNPTDSFLVVTVTRGRAVFELSLPPNSIRESVKRPE